MPHDVFEQLAAREPPPIPESFDREVHQRLNENLSFVHLLDFVLRALPWAAMEFGRAVIGLMRLTLTGSFQRPPRERDEHA